MLLKLATCLRYLFHSLTVVRHALTAVLLLLEWLVRGQTMHLQEKVRNLSQTRDLRLGKTTGLLDFVQDLA